MNYITNTFPLLNDHVEMSRYDCMDWLWQEYRRRAPKSACKQCPYQEPERLLHLQKTDTAGFSELCEFDANLRTPQQIARFRGELYVHSSCVPLIQIDLTSLCADREDKNLNLFTNECEGMCGV